MNKEKLKTIGLIATSIIALISLVLCIIIFVNSAGGKSIHFNNDAITLSNTQIMQDESNWEETYISGTITNQGGTIVNLVIFFNLLDTNNQYLTYCELRVGNGNLSQEPNFILLPNDSYNYKLKAIWSQGGTDERPQKVYNVSTSQISVTRLLA